MRHPGLRPGVASSASGITVLFVCPGNSSRSPMAEALLRHHTGDTVTVTSAGTRPKPEVHPDAVRALREQFDIDIAGQQPRHLDTLAGRHFDQVITLCDKARESCPEIGPRRHWSVPDPADAGFAAF